MEPESRRHLWAPQSRSATLRLFSELDGLGLFQKGRRRGCPCLGKKPKQRDMRELEDEEGEFTGTTVFCPLWEERRGGDLQKNGSAEQLEDASPTTEPRPRTQGGLPGGSQRTLLPWAVSPQEGPNQTDDHRALLDCGICTCPWILP